MFMKITIVGTGYVGLSNAVLLSQYFEVVALDIDPKRVAMVNKRLSPIGDPDIEAYLKKDLSLTATTNAQEAYTDADYVIIATPTDYNPDTNEFDTRTVKSVIDSVQKENPMALIIIKSTLPVGFVEVERERTRSQNIIFSPEFLREGSAIKDNLYPSRIIIGEKSVRAKKVAALFERCSLLEENLVIYTNPTEAEAIKLFANTYLAMRVAYFNELDMYAETRELDAKDIIEGVGADLRIGAHYNNPSFGYGGYCLPKDTRQLLANFNGIDNAIIASVVESNKLRKDYIVKSVLGRNAKLVGIYKLAMKSDSDNFRSAAILDIMKSLHEQGVAIVLYEPSLSGDDFGVYPLEKDLNAFKLKCDCILANRMDHNIYDVSAKVYTRDIFGAN